MEVLWSLHQQVKELLTPPPPIRPRRIGFADAIHVALVPSHRDYSDEERSNSWYSASDIALMKTQEESRQLLANKSRTAVNEEDDYEDEEATTEDGPMPVEPTISGIPIASCDNERVVPLMQKPHIHGPAPMMPKSTLKKKSAYHAGATCTTSVVVDTARINTIHQQATKAIATTTASMPHVTNELVAKLKAALITARTSRIPPSDPIPIGPSLVMERGLPHRRMPENVVQGDDDRKKGEGFRHHRANSFYKAFPPPRAAPLPLLPAVPDHPTQSPKQVLSQTMAPPRGADDLAYDKARSSSGKNIAEKRVIPSDMPRIECTFMIPDICGPFCKQAVGVMAGCVGIGLGLAATFVGSAIIPICIMAGAVTGVAMGFAHNIDRLITTRQRSRPNPQTAQI